MEGKKNNMARRRRGRLKSVSGCADFFKVFLLHHSSRQLLIPPDYVKDFKRTLFDKVVLKDVCGRKWHVEVRETRDGVFLKDGWQAFVDDHSLKHGEFLVFEYTRSYEFVVRIYGYSLCKKEDFKSISADVRIKIESAEEEIEQEQPSHKRPRIEGDHKCFQLIRCSDNLFGEEPNVTVERSNKTVNVESYPSRAKKRGPGRPRKNASVLTYVDDGVKEIANISDEELRYSEELPGFCKLYIPDMCSETMRVPPQFIGKFGENIPRVCKLKAPAGKPKHVHMNKISDNWFFQKGWPEFVQYYSLEDGDFLTFSYARNSTFHVRVFKRNGCRNIPENVDAEPAENLLENEACLPENLKNTRVTRRSLIPKSSIEKESAREYPSFTRKLTASNITQVSLTVPMKFWRDHMSEIKGSKEVTLWMKKRKWIVYLKNRGGRVVLLGGGVSKFLSDYSLKEGALCTYELITGANGFAFRVKIP